MSETEIKAAIAEQEDHIKRESSCKGQVGLPHAWRDFKGPAEYTGTEQFKRCTRCLISKQKLPFEYYTRLVISGC